MGWELQLTLSLAGGVLGGWAAYALGTRLFPSRGGYEDHEERLELLESVTRTVQRAQKAERMRQLRAAQGEDSGTLQSPDKDQLPLPVGAGPTDPHALKNALRRKVFGATRL